MILSTSGLVLYFWIKGEVGPGAVAAATAMAMRLNGISHWIMWEMSTLFENIGTVKDGITMFSQPLTVEDAPGAKDLQVGAGEIQFHNVSFGYREELKIFSDLNLTIRAGEKIALVGPSGAGKSTLTNLLLRLYDIQGGKILIDGQDISKVTLDSLQANIAMVTQDTSLLHRSIAENLRYGRPQASDQEIRRAAQDAEAEAFIEGMQDLAGRRGFDAHVGERGVKLSGGQRQRIAIARVMLKNAPILVLDEATSALDSEVEAAIQESLGRLMQGKTVLAIAHRLSTIAAMDRLIVMDQGKIVEMGSHQELLDRQGLYARLWTRQSGGFLALKDE
jgi:ATP-binding cassette, subfamily B, multidrug efflux pump